MSRQEETNRLIDETSPYLLQHAHNPVEWYPWGEEALEKARREDKPILLSIGYAACHWCHVMERESFEDPEIAELMNEHFVCVKVDREERPDLDDIYMTAVQAMTGQGGWPLTVFLTPDLKPFWGGTYFPPQDRMGMPGLPTVLRSMAEAYEEQRDRLESVAGDLTERLQADAHGDRGPEVLDTDLVNAGVRQLRGRFDGRWGGFSSAPKFPQAGNISLLLRYAWHHGDEEAREMATLTLDRMAAGGIHDHVGGGFHRYSTDERWLVPHFEKMLYDNALLADVYLEAFQLTGDEHHRDTAVDTLDWVLREMQDEAGGYHSTLDADTEGEEGKFYVWKRAEVEEVLGDDGPLFCAAYDIVAGGNWEGKCIPNRKHETAELAREFDLSPEQVEERLERCRGRLLEVREKRVRPGLDDKVLTDWNGLMIAAMARAHRLTGEDRFLESARRAAHFVLEELIHDDRLLHVWRRGEAKLLAYLDDHANMVRALVELYRTTFRLEWLRQARHLAERMIELFLDDDDGGFYFTGTDHEELIARRKTGHDGATPSGNAVAAGILQTLATLTGEDSFRQHAVDTLHAFQAPMRRAPTAFATMLLAVDDYLQDPREIVVAADRDAPETDEALRRLWRQYAPSDVVVSPDPEATASEIEEEIPLLAGKTARDGRPTYYVCHDYVCEAPTDSLEEVLEARSR